MSPKPLISLTGIAILSFTASACSAAEPPPRPEGRIVASLGEIAGSWDIVRLGDYAPVRLHGGTRGAYVTVGKDGLRYTIECNHSGNAARIDSAGVLHDKSERTGSRLTTLMLCSPEKMRRDGQLFGFFATKPKVRWVDGGRVLMDNGTTTLLLERPATRRLANAPSAAELNGRWVPVMALSVEPGGGHSGWGFGQDPGVVTIKDDTLTWSICPNAVVRFRYSADFRLKRIGTEPPRCDVSSRYAGLDVEAPSRLARLLAASPAVERTAEGGIALFTDSGEVISLRREADLEAEAQAARQPVPPGMPIPEPAPPPPPIFSQPSMPR